MIKTHIHSSFYNIQHYPILFQKYDFTGKIKKLSGYYLLSPIWCELNRKGIVTQVTVLHRINLGVKENNNIYGIYLGGYSD